MKIVELYSDADLQRLARRIKVWRIAMAALALAALAACIAMTANVTTANAARMELYVIALWTVAGWIVIYCSLFVIRAAKRELGHAQMLREEKREAVEGVLTVSKERLIIRKSIPIRQVEVRSEGQVRRLMVCESRAKALAASGARKVYVAHSYIAAYEEVTP